MPLRFQNFRGAIVLSCLAIFLLGDSLKAVELSAQAAASEDQEYLLAPGQLDSLVAPIALYPDGLLGQTLVASTYPLEVVQLQQWLAQNANLNGEALADAIQNQDWDPSVQAMSAFPDVVKQLADNIKWTTDLGNAFLDQEKDVMDAVQRMRGKAQGAGNLKSTDQQTVQTKVVETKTVIVIQPANPQVVYVPVYNPVVVFGPPLYPYPPMYYPPPGFFGSGIVISFGRGISYGAWSGGWGWGPGWGRNSVIIINPNNRYIHRYPHWPNGYRPVPGGVWRHNPYHRGGAPYPGRGRPTPGRPAPGRPTPGRPGSGVPTPGRPSPGPTPGKPGGGGPTPGKPGSGAPTPGKPGVGPTPGKPGSGNPSPGKPGTGVPAPGRPGNGGATPGRPGGDTPTKPGTGIPPTPGKPGNGAPTPGKPGSGGSTPARPGSGKPPARPGSADQIGGERVPKAKNPANPSPFGGAGAVSRKEASQSSQRGKSSVQKSNGSQGNPR